MADMKQQLANIPEVSALIVTDNSARTILNCLQSLIQQQDIILEIIIVDNNSQDKTTQIITQFLLNHSMTISKLPNICLIQLDNKTSFGNAANRAAQHAQGEYLAILHSDIKLKSTQALHQCIQYGQQYPKIGIIGTETSDQQSMITNINYQYPYQEFVGFDTTKLSGKIAWLISHCVLIKTQLFKQLRGLSTTGVTDIVDCDFYLRIRQAGYQIGYLPEIEIAVEPYRNATSNQTELYDKYLLSNKTHYAFCIQHYTIAQVRDVLLHDQRIAKKQIKTKRLLGYLIPKFRQQVISYQALYDTATDYLHSLEQKQ